MVQGLYCIVFLSSRKKKKKKKLQKPEDPMIHAGLYGLEAIMLRCAYIKGLSKI